MRLLILVLKKFIIQEIPQFLVIIYIINSIFKLIIENCDLSDKDQITVRELFIEFKEQTSVGDGNPCDYDTDGNLLSIDEWCERNNVSMASGVADSLEIAHIVSKDKRADLRDCVWNFLRLTHYEHIEIQHKKGWNEFLSIYPHLIPRVNNAYDMSHELYPFDLDLLENKSDETSKSVEKLQKEEVQDDFVFHNEKYQGDIF